MFLQYFMLFISSILHIKLVMEFKNRIGSDLILQYDKAQIISPLSDAILCVKSKYRPEFFMNKSFNERMNHTKWINKKIKLITPKKLKLDGYCYSGFCGPWAETLWITMEIENYNIFGPFVPLFVPWLSMWKNYRKDYYNWRDKILNFLSKEYFYITLSQNDDGIEGRDEISNILPDNLIVISSGGKGHIPIFLFMYEYNPTQITFGKSFKYDLMFAGKFTHPLRKLMVNFYSKQLGDKFKFFSEKINWQNEYPNSKFICAPRGYGRNSFRLTEILQIGSIPIYVYNDIIWLPYYDSINWSSFSIFTSIFQLNKTIEKIKNTKADQIEKMRQKILSLYSSHFTINATFNQIKFFLKYGFTKSDLRCAIYSSSRGKST